jgi:ABC-type oligopeptide transport system substrate-binding subunit
VRRPDNYSGYCDPAYDAAFAAFAALPAGPGRDHAAAELERMLGEDVPVRPIDQPEAWYLAQPWLRGLSATRSSACASSCCAPIAEDHVEGASSRRTASAW